MRTFFIFITLSVTYPACQQPTSGPTAVTPTPPMMTLAQKLEKTYHRASLDTVRCKDGTAGQWTYIGCRYGSDDSGSMIWYIDGQVVYGANGDAMSKVAKLNEPWIKEGSRPAPSGVNIQDGMRVTR